MKTLRTILLAAAVTTAITFASCNLDKAPPILLPNAPELPSQPPYEETQPILEPITAPGVPIEEPIEPEPIIPPPVPRGDLLVSIYTDTYNVGDIFNYSGRAQSSRVEDILIEEGGLSWKLMRGNIKVGGSVIQNLQVKLLQQGFIEVSYEDGKVKATASNTEIDYDGKHYKIPYPLKMSFSYDVDPLFFKTPGIHHLDIGIKYTYEGEEYDSTFKGEDFVVQ